MASEAIFGESEAAPYLAEEKWAADPFTTSLKGRKSSYTIHKVSRPRA